MVLKTHTTPLRSLPQRLPHGLPMHVPDAVVTYEGPKHINLRVSFLCGAGVPVKQNKIYSHTRHTFKSKRKKVQLVWLTEGLIRIFLRKKENRFILSVRRIERKKKVISLIAYAL